MLRRRVKDALKRRLPGLVRLRDSVREWREDGAASASEPPISPFAVAPAPAPAVQVAPAVQAAPAAPTAPGLDADAIQAVLDEMVRPALQSDGGDITLVRVEGNDVFVSLVGACHSCPSATVTMRMGVERLLKEEFPTMGRLVEVGGALYA